MKKQKLFIAQKTKTLVTLTFVMLLCVTSFAQTNLISASDGGFENATTTLAANGWTAANSTGSAWTCGTGAGAYSGTKSGYIASSGSTYGYTNGTNKISHLYRDVTIPAGVTGLTLSFQLQSGGEVGADRLFVSTAPTSVTPTTTSTSGYVTQITGATLLYVQPALIPTYSLIAIHLPNSYAGTTVRLIFSWMNDAGTQTNPDPASIDNVSLTYWPVPPATGACGYSFAATGAVQTYSVPVGCSQLSVDAWGGAGGTVFYQSSVNTSYNLGGQGGRTQATISVTPSTISTATILQVRTGGVGANATSGGGGAGGYNGGGNGSPYNANNNAGGGGGASDVRLSPYGLADRAVVAGGGGGGGFNSGFGRQDERGGNGGGTTAEAGYYGGGFDATQAGQAGTPTAGGLKASGSAVGNDGALGTGGDGTTTATTSIGGGGGGGYYGGGSGYFGGGGGGSSYAIPAATGVTYTQGMTPYNGIVYITPAAPAVYGVSSTGSVSCSGGSLTISLSGSQTGVNYQLYSGSTPIGSPLTGNGSSISFASISASGTYTVAAYYTGYSGCLTAMTGSVVIASSGPDVSNLATAASSPCTGSASTVTITSTTLSSSTTYSVTYTLSGANTGTFTAVMAFGTGSGTFSIISANLPAAGATTITINSIAISSGCSSNTTTGNTANFSVLTGPGSITGSTSICSGLFVFLTDATSGGVWSSSSTAIATVSSSGVVTGGATLGSANITYSVGCGTDAVITVTVVATPGTISGPSSVCAGSSITLSDAVTGGTWSSANTNVATIDPSTGVLHGITGGPVNISYLVGCSTGTSITVNSGPGAITGGGGSLCSGLTATLSDATTGGVWTSSNTNIATVNTTGTVGGGTPGTVIITYSTGCGANATTTLTISTSPGTITGPSFVCSGSGIILSEAATGGVWSSANSGVATINPSSGAVSGVSSGTTIISYLLGCSAITTITVAAAPGSISGATNVCSGLSVTLSDPVAGGVWSSGSASIASVTSGGVVTGGTVGTTTITYSTGCGSDAVITFSVSPSITPSAITGSTTTVCTGATIFLTDATAGGAWSSTAAGVATVNSTGMVTGVNTGSATISYSVSNSCGTVAATTIVTVDAGSAGVISGKDSVCPGSGHVITLSDNISGGVWSSSNTSRATIDPVTGVVGGRSSGTVTISYVVSSTCGTYTATYVVQVRTPAQCATGTGPIEEQAAILKVFPNPNAGTWTMELLSDDNEPVQVTVTNVVGEKVMTFTAETNKEQQIKLNKAVGIYFLTATTAHGSNVVKVIVIN